MTEYLREILYEACENDDVERVKKIIYDDNWGEDDLCKGYYGGDCSRGEYCKPVDFDNLELDDFCYVAIQHNNFEMLKILETRAELKNPGLFYEACVSTNNIKMIKYLYKKTKPDVSDDGYEIVWAAEKGFLKTVKFLIKIGYDPFINDSLPISLAGIHRHYNVCKYLLELGSDNEGLPKQIRYEVMCEYKNKLMAFMQTVKGNNYLKMEILKLMLPQFTYFEIAKVM